ncbi:MAG TPA: ABC transporter ATP-binding protein [Candidatus Scatomorpha merdipullorum]|uniref:ABC transporter ATP-binding protein n=1 Tax=Candidatus Scatomorpha merdipullorum TaxID=2840927 RepID=A0A9D1JV83_9FIRM|nr:ABC transporter ATP-binding protein [Candidatus Scatomorpha merdipullorum]
MGCAALAAVIDLVFPYVSRMSMTRLLPERMFAAFFAVMAVMIAAYILKGVCYYFITVLGHRMGVYVEADMRRAAFNHIQKLSFSFFDHNRTGALMSRITSDLFEITELAHHGPEDILISCLTIVGALAVMFTIEWRLALVLAVTLPLLIAFTLSRRVRMKRANLEVKRKTAEINSAIESGISGIRTAKAFANEKAEDDKFVAANEKYKAARREYFNAMGGFMSGMEFTTSIMQVLVIAAGGFFIMRGSMDYVDLMTFTLYVSTFVTPVRKLATFSETYMQGTAGFSRFLELMRTEPEIKDAPDADELEGVKGEVEYRGVGFRYGPDKPWVLRGIDLKIAPGEKLAVVGPSGGGKTTLCQLLERFYDVTEGAVLVDGRDVRTVTQESLHRSIGIIQQDVFIFAGTIRDNIRYGKPDATDAEIIAAAVRAEIHQDIMAMPEGYDTFVGERGVMLSGGQKQRLSIARVFLKNPPILVMDEATSALDSVTEQRIQQSLDSLAVGRTSVIIAHRLSTIRGADRVAVIEDERIVELGAPAELLERGGEFAKLWKSQFDREET